MICLDKLQKVIARELKIPLDTLPNIHDSLRNAGFSEIKKGNEIISLEVKHNEIKEHEKIESSNEKANNIIDEFGQNYPQFYHKGNEAVTHLLETRSGQVAGAFYKEGLGDIDLVWGDSKFGLAHILERRTQQYGEEKALRFIKDLPRIIDEAIIYEDLGDRVVLKTSKETLILGKRDNNKFVLSGFYEGKNKKLGIGSLGYEANLTDKSGFHNNGGILSSNQHIDSTTTLPKIPSIEEQFKAAKDLETKKNIIVSELQTRLKPLKERHKELMNQKTLMDFEEFEIQGAINYIQQNAERNNTVNYILEVPSTQEIKGKRGYCIIDTQKLPTPREQAKKFLSYELSQNEIYPLQDKIESMDKLIKKMEFDYSVRKENSANLARLEKTLESQIKKISKLEKEYNKSLALTYDLNTQDGLKNVRKLFESNPTDAEQKALFEAILPVAQKLGVKVRGALRDPYSVTMNSKEALGLYTYKDNMARILHNGAGTKHKSQTLLHELIHSVTSRAMLAYEKGQTELLTPMQIKALENINHLYKQINENPQDLGFTPYGKKHEGDYGLKNTHELIAELSNPQFVEKLKKVNVFEKLIDNIMKLIVSVKEYIGLKKSNAYDSLKQSLMDIIENYKPNFSKEWESKDFRKHLQVERGVEAKDVENKSVLESRETMQGQRVANVENLQGVFLDSSGQVDYHKLMQNAEELPQELNYKGFIAQFENPNKAIIQTPIKDIAINPKYAFYHLTKRGDKKGNMGNGKQERLRLNGAVLQTLQRPLFITQDTERGSYYFYKPFIDKKGLLHFVSVAVDKNNKLLYKTSYDINEDKLKRMITEHKMLYFAGKQ